MDDCYHVYLDNTNAPDTVPNIFKWVGPQNWYIVKAKDGEHAKQIVLGLFQKHGDRVMYILSKCLSVTKSSAIYDHLKSPSINLWSYVPHGEYRQPGQQTRYPSVDQIRKVDRDGHAVSREFKPPRPVVPEGQDNTNDKAGRMDAEDAEIVNSQTASQMPQNMNPEQMMAMMQQMMTMMQNGGQPQQSLPTDSEINSMPSSKPIHSDPNLQAELASKMDDIMKPGIAETVSDDEAMGGDLDLSKVEY